MRTVHALNLSTSRKAMDALKARSVLRNSIVQKQSLKEEMYSTANFARTCAKSYYCEFDGVCSTEMWVLKTNAQTCCGAYLAELVQTDRFISAACVTSGTKMPRAELERGIQSPIPPPFRTATGEDNRCTSGSQTPTTPLPNQANEIASSKRWSDAETPRRLGFRNGQISGGNGSMSTRKRTHSARPRVATARR